MDEFPTEDPQDEVPEAPQAPGLTTKERVGQVKDPTFTGGRVGQVKDSTFTGGRVGREGDSTFTGGRVGQDADPATTRGRVGQAKDPRFSSGRATPPQADPPNPNPIMAEMLALQSGTDKTQGIRRQGEFTGEELARKAQEEEHLYQMISRVSQSVVFAEFPQLFDTYLPPSLKGLIKNIRYADCTEETPLTALMKPGMRTYWGPGVAGAGGGQWSGFVTDYWGRTILEIDISDTDHLYGTHICIFTGISDDVADIKPTAGTICQADSICSWHDGVPPWAYGNSPWISFCVADWIPPDPPTAGYYKLNSRTAGDIHLPIPIGAAYTVLQQGAGGNSDKGVLMAYPKAH